MYSSLTFAKYNSLNLIAESGHIGFSFQGRRLQYRGFSYEYNIII